MYDRELVLEILKQISESIIIIRRRFEPVKSTNAFTDSDTGMEKLDSICMQLIAIGESLKNIDKITNKSLFQKYTQIEWDKIKGMRDIVSHHYFDVDAEIIFDVCKNRLEALAQVINQIILDLSS